MPAPSSESFSGLKKTLDSPTYLFVFDQLPAVGLLDTTLHIGQKLRATGEHAIDRVYDYLLGVPAGGRGYLPDLIFDVGREVDVHVRTIALRSFERLRLVLQFLRVGFCVSF